MNEKEIEKLVEELVDLERKKKEVAARIKEIKGEIIDFTNTETINDKTWMTDNAYVEVTTVTKYKLADVPADFKISSDIAAIDVAEKAFKPKVQLSKEGKKMFKQQHPTIVKLMIPSIKKQLKVVV